MADWQEAVQASIIALLFALMVAKLVSVVISFRGENLRVERGAAPGKEELHCEEEVGDTSSSSESDNWDENQVSKDKFEEAEKVVGVEETDRSLDEEVVEEAKDSRDTDVGLHPLVGTQTTKNLSSDVDDEEAEELNTKPVSVESDESSLDLEEKKSKETAEASGELSDSDDWEGVESTELDEKFGAAATFVATQAVGSGLRVSNETQLLLYGLYKLATEGPCSTPQPAAYKMSARAKWCQITACCYGHLQHEHIVGNVKPDSCNFWLYYATESYGMESYSHKILGEVIDLMPNIRKLPYGLELLRAQLPSILSK